tara:strand:+ start:28867 stop:31218 length:2352 start_codon:yes stop_codon:yes gene_type:complete
MSFPVKSIFSFTLIVACCAAANAQPVQAIAGTKPLVLNEPMDEWMVRGINQFATREIELAASRRQKRQRDYSSVAAYQKQIEPSRQRFSRIIGVSDPRETADGFHLQISLAQGDSHGRSIAKSKTCEAFCVQWPVLGGVTGEGILLRPLDRETVAHVIAIPDAAWSPETFVGLTGDREQDKNSQVLLHLVRLGCEVLVPRLINREADFSGHPDVRFTNQPHREFVYRTSFQVGRHIIGYEVQKVLGAIDQFAHRDTSSENRRIGVMGIGEGGLLAMYSAAIDPRIESTLVCGYFDRRDDIWAEPIYRNVWGLLTEFGDAEIAGLIAPRNLTIEACRAPEIDGPPKATSEQRASAAPGTIRTPPVKRARSEFEIARQHYDVLGRSEDIHFVVSDDGQGSPGSDAAISNFLDGLDIAVDATTGDSLTLHSAHLLPNHLERQKQQVAELVDYSQSLVRRSARLRDLHWRKADRSSIDAWTQSTQVHREAFYNQVIGRIPDPTIPLNPRSRRVASEAAFDTYEVALDVYPDVVAGGLLLLPSNLKDGEKRPVVVCQHGLEGTPQWTLQPHKGGFHDRGFAAELAQRGFIVYAPQNPYRGGDDFRQIQRKSNPLQRSLFSYIIPQHRRTLQWLSTLPHVDADRIAFYGISYGGKTAMRVPTMLREYALSICSADFNEWIVKTTSVTHPTSYVFAPEYEIWEWNMAHVANYAELASLMTPRPFMVERGHRDGVAPDEWVAWEYAKVRRHYDELGIGDRTEIEFFNGPHTIHGKGTFDFLHRHLDWPAAE